MIEEGYGFTTGCDDSRLPATHVRGSAGAPDLVGVPEKVASPGFELRTPLWAQDFAPRFL